MNKPDRKILHLLRELSLLNEQPRNGRPLLDMALELLAGYFQIKRGAISIVDPADGKIRIRAAYGLKENQILRGEYRSGEGVTGNVIASGQPMHISDISREPLFLNRTGARKPDREKVSFSCVPLMLAGKALGAIWIDQIPGKSNESEEELDYLRIVASMLAPLAHEERYRQPEPEKVKNLGRFIGSCANIQKVYAQIIQVAPYAMTVLLEGESGTGKELAALAIHEAGNRANGPFISLNCAALPEHLVESELFGHERGAFTGASQMRKGRFELADHGTLFLDEIGDMSLAMQAKLLRVLQDHSFERVGGMRPLKVDVRVVAATNRNLAQMVQEGSFRRDLFYRLNVFPIHMPPLRERIEDLPALARHFLEEQADIDAAKAPAISSEAMDLLCQYSWPGNVRELRNALERASLLAGGSHILPEHLPENIRSSRKRNSQNADFASPASLPEKLQELEKEAIACALEKSGGHIGKAARKLGMTERILSLRLGKYGINYREYRKRRKCAKLVK